MAVLLDEWAKLNSERSAYVDEQIALAREWTRILRGVDPSLSLVWIGENAHASGLTPGRWHVRRLNPPPAAHSYMPIMGPNGEYMEPHSGILNELGARDLWKGVRKHREILDRVEDAKRKARKLEREQIRDEMALSYRAAKRVAGEGGMTKRVWGKA